MSDTTDAVRKVAGILLDLFPIPDGEIRDTLLDIANPCRAQVKEIVKRSDPEDERPGLRKAFKAFDSLYMSDTAAADLIDRALNPADIDVVTVSHDQTVTALTSLRNDLRNENGDGEENVDREYDREFGAIDAPDGPDAMSVDEAEAIRQFLADRREANDTEVSS
jgi:hypothetical protein